MYLNEWIIVLLIFILLIGGYWAGYLFGLKFHSSSSDRQVTRASNIQAGLMGLLGVMLAFSFSISAQRFEQRRQLIIQESMNIGTAYFRAGLLPDTLSKDIRKIIRAYLHERISFYHPGSTPNDMEKIQTQSENLQVQIWGKTAELGRPVANLNINLNVLSLNSMIETTGNASSLFQSRVPVFIHILLTFITISTVLIIGYADGITKTFNTPFMFLLNIVLCSILLLIIDLDTPTSGFLKSDTYSLIKLQEEIIRYGK